MNTILEKIFEERTKESGNEILYSQWKTDKNTIIKALDAITVLFPHYSLHNESHSITIINNITRILGEENLKRLSSIDLWLIIEAAYSHDLGMVVTVDMIEEAFNPKDGVTGFIDYFIDISKNNFHPLHKYSQLFDIKDNKIHYKTTELTLYIHDSIKFLLADFFRKSHAKNVKKIISSPDEILAMPLQKTNIPDRIYSILGEICAAHTESFDIVLQLPFSEVGLGVEDAHPRFIACLLRLGDVLDIDNARFSETLLRTISELPPDTELHKKKHASISHMRIDRKSIEVEAVCKHPKVANVIKEWFHWIKQEFGLQVTNWNRIVPNQDYGYLPTIDKLNIDLKGYIVPEKPSFTIDVSRALELLQGTNFYEDPFDAIREILQNAVDSMLLKYWIDHKHTFSNNNIIDELLKKINANGDKILINISTEDKGSCEIQILDRGIGISRNDLSFLSSPGTSFKNSNKRKYINEMPEEIKPSGVYGIGFQSLFLLTDKVIIKTKSYFSDEQLEITLYSPTSNEYKGDIYLKIIDFKEERLDYGAEVSFSIKKNIVKFLPINTILDSFNTVTKSIIYEKIKKYSELSFFPIEIDGILNRRVETYQYISETHSEIKIDDYKSFAYNFKLCFKNALVKTDKFNSLIKFLPAVNINIHGEKANEILDISRNNTIRSAQSKIKEIIINTILNYIEINKDWTDKNILGISMFLRYYRIKKEELFSKYPNIEKAYLDFSIQTYKDSILNNKSFFARILGTSPIEHQLKDICAANHLTITNNYFLHDFRNSYIELVYTLNDGSEKKINYYYNDGGYDFLDSFRFLMKELFVTYNIFLIDPLKKVYKGVKKGEAFPEISYGLDKAITYQIVDNEMIFIPVVQGYYQIMIKNDIISDNYYDNYSIYDKIPVQMILFPFKKYNNKWENCLNDSLYEWVYSQRADSNMTIDNIKETYDKLVKECFNVGIVK